MDAAYSVAEPEHQFEFSVLKALFTCLPLLPLSVQAASNCGIPKNHIYLFTLPKEANGVQEGLEEYKTLDKLIMESLILPKLDSKG